MNNLFTPQQDAIVKRIDELQKQAEELIQQRKQVRHDKFLKHEYEITISHVLGAIQRLSLEIAKEKPIAKEENL